MTKVKRIDKLLRARAKITKIIDSDCSEDVEERAQVQYLFIQQLLTKEGLRLKRRVKVNIIK